MSLHFSLSFDVVIALELNLQKYPLRHYSYIRIFSDERLLYRTKTRRMLIFKKNYNTQTFCNKAYIFIYYNIYTIYHILYLLYSIYTLCTIICLPNNQYLYFFTFFLNKKKLCTNNI